MRLTWKDGVATALVGFVVAAAFAVAGSWGWPLLGSERAAILVLGVVGIAACAVAGGGAGAAAKEPPRFEGPIGAIAALLHIGVAVLVVIGLVMPSAVVVFALAADIGVLWMVGTMHHVLPSTQRSQRALDHLQS